MSPLISSGLAAIGILKVDLELSPLLVAGIIGGIVTVVLTVTLAASLRLRKVSAYSLLQE